MKRIVNLSAPSRSGLFAGRFGRTEITSRVGDDACHHELLQ